MRRKLAELFNLLYGFRKMIVLVILYLVGVAFRIADLINGAEMVDLFKTTTIAFIGANGVEHIVGAVSAYAGSKAPADDPKTAYEDIVPVNSHEADDAAEEAKNGK